MKSGQNPYRNNVFPFYSANAIFVKIFWIEIGYATHNTCNSNRIITYTFILAPFHIHVFSLHLLRNIFDRFSSANATSTLRMKVNVLHFKISNKMNVIWKAEMIHYLWFIVAS